MCACRLLVTEIVLCSLSEYLYRTAEVAQKTKLAPVDTLLEHTDVLEWKLEVIVQYLHHFHILHGDIKSSNVMLFHDIHGILINEILSGAMPWGGGAREVNIMNWVTLKVLRPEEMWTVSSPPSAAERELFAIVGSSDSVHRSCLHQSAHHRPAAYEVVRAANGHKTSAPPQKRESSDISQSAKRASITRREIISVEDQELIMSFAVAFMVRYNDICHENAMRYAETLFGISVTTCERFEQQLKLHRRHQPAQTVNLLEEQVLRLQGAIVLERWMESNVPTINIPRNR